MLNNTLIQHSDRQDREAVTKKSTDCKIDLRFSEYKGSTPHYSQKRAAMNFQNKITSETLTSPVSQSNLSPPSRICDLEIKVKDFTAQIQRLDDYEQGESVCCHYSCMTTDELTEGDMQSHRSIILPNDYKESKLSIEKSSFQSLNTLRNFDSGEESNLRDASSFEGMIQQVPTFILKSSSGGWKHWWSRKKEIQRDFQKACALNLTEQIMKILASNEPEMLPDLNYPLKEDGWTALHFAAFYGNATVCNLYLQKDAQLDVLNNLAQTPLLICCIENKQSVASLLIESGANINTQDIFLNTPLHYCFLNGDKDLLDVILRKQNVDFTLRNMNGKLAEEQSNNQELIAYYKSQEVKKQEQRTHKMSTSQAKDKSSISTVENSKQLQMAQIIEDFPAVERIGYEVDGLLGKGTFGEVYLVRNSKTNEEFAMKVLHKQQILEKDLVKYAVAERNILQISKHPFIIKMSQAFQTEDKLFFILENGARGDILQHIRMEEKFSEAKAKFYAAETLLALDHLHSMNIIYRDLKSQNVLIGADGHVRLSDFGLSKEGITQYDKGTNSFCGSISYMPPEVIRSQGHGKSIDLYLLGVFIYEMLTGVTPYQGKDEQTIYSNIESGTLKFPFYVSRTAKSLLVKKEPRFRPSPDAIKRHPFFSGINWKDLEQKKVEPPKSLFQRQSLYSTQGCVFKVGEIVETSAEAVFQQYEDSDKAVLFNKWSFIAH